MPYAVQSSTNSATCLLLALLIQAAISCPLDAREWTSWSSPSLYGRGRRFCSGKLLGRAQVARNPSGISRQLQARCHQLQSSS